jgi:hypothetical protein
VWLSHVRRFSRAHAVPIAVLAGAVAIGSSIVAARSCNAAAESSMREQRAALEVVTKFLELMTARNAETATHLFSADVDPTKIQEVLQRAASGDEYALYDGYLNIKPVGWSISRGTMLREIRELQALVYYEGNYTGRLFAELSKEGGRWTIRNIRITVPHEKSKKYGERSP